MSALTADIPCPKCGAQEMWDNRTTKRNPNAPDYKCKDRACDGCVWPPRNGAAPRAAAPAPAASRTVKQPISNGGPLPGESPYGAAAEEMTECLILAERIATGRNLAQYNGDTVGAIQRIAVTLFLNGRGK